MTQLSLAPSRLDLEIYAGDGVNLTVTATDVSNKPINVSGTYKAQIRQHKSDSGTPLATFTIDSTNASTGVLILKLTGAQTLALVSGTGDDPFRGYWDCQWTPSGAEPTTLLQGAVRCDVDVSR